MNYIRLVTMTVICSLCTFDYVYALGLEELGKSAEVATGLYNALRGYGQEKKEPSIDALMKDAKKRGFSEEVQLNALLEYASKNNDPAVAERIRSILRQKDKQEIKRTVHKWGFALLATQLVMFGVIVYVGKRIIDNQEGNTF